MLNVGYEDAYRNYPAGLVIEMFQYALAEDQVNQLHSKQPGNEKGLRQLEKALADAQEMIVIPMSNEAKGGVTEDELDQFVALSKLAV